MSSDIDIKASLSNLAKELGESKLLNIDFSSEGCLEIIPSSLGEFFDAFELGKEFEFTTLFDRSFNSDDGTVEFNKQRITRKNRYSKSELIDKFSPSLLQPNKLISSSLPLNQDRALAYLEGQSNVYLTFGNFFYQQKDQRSISISPLVFFKVRIRRWNNTFYLALDYNSPLYNEPLFSYLKKTFNISCEPDTSSFDFMGIVSQINQKAKELSFASDYSINLIQADITHDLKLASVINYAPKMSSDPVFASLNEHKTSHDTYLCKLSHPSYVNRNLDMMVTNNVVVIDQKSKLSEAFIKDTVDEFILHKDNVLLVTPNLEEKQKAIKSLESQYYDAFICYKNIFEPGTALFTTIEAASNKPGYLIDSSVLLARENLKATEEKNRILIKKLVNNDLPLDQTYLDTYINYVKYKSKQKKTYKFDETEEYTYENYLGDLEFISFVNSNTEFKDVSFTTHPYYGLNSAVKENQYDDIIRFMVTMSNDIDKFNDSINQAKVKTSHWSDFNSLKDFDDSNKLFTIFAKYDGFPTSYFEVDFTPDLLNSIDNLINYFRLEASIRLSIDVLCQPEIWTLDFDEVLEAVDNRKMLKVLMKQMKSIIKIMPLKKNFKTLVVLIDKFQDNKRKIGAELPNVKKVFGGQGETIDGLLSIKNSYEFIMSYQRHKKLYDDLNFDNPFTDSIFNDKDFSYKYRSVYYPSLIEMRSVLEHDLDKYRKIFDEDKDDYFSASFDDIKKTLNRRISAPKESFLAYLQFSRKADSGSRQLIDALVDQEIHDENLANFENDYLSSLYEYLMFKSAKVNNFTSILEESSSNMFTMYNMISQNQELDRIDTVKSFNMVKATYITKPSYTQTISGLKTMYHMKRMLSIQQALKMSGDVFFHVYPLTVVYKDEIEAVLSYKFDLAIVDLENSDSDIDFLTALMCAKKVILLNGGKFSKYFPHLSFNLANDMESLLTLRKYPESFIQSLKKAYLRQGIILEENKVIDNNLTVPFYFEKEKEKFALGIKEEIGQITYQDDYIVPSMLINCYNIKVTSIYPLPFVVYPDLSVMSTYRDVKSVILKMKDTKPDEKKMTYDQKRRADYFAALKSIYLSFKDYEKPLEVEPDLSNSPLCHSTTNERPITNISYFEIASGILTYLSSFTFLSEDTLIREISEVVGTNEKDVDFRLLFLRAETYLISKGLVEKNENKLSLVR